MSAKPVKKPSNKTARLSKKYHLQIPAKHLVPKRLLAGLCIVLAFLVLIIAGFILLALNAANTYTVRAKEQQGIIISQLRGVAEISQKQKQETLDADKLRDALTKLNSSLDSLQTPILEDVPFGEQLSQPYKSAKDRQINYEKNVGQLRAVIGRLVAYGQYQGSLHAALNSPNLSKPVTDEKTTLERQKTWQLAAEQLQKIETNETVLRSASELLEKDVLTVVKQLKTLGGYYKDTDIEAIKKQKVKLDNQFDMLRNNADVLAEFRHELQDQLSQAISKLD